MNKVRIVLVSGILLLIGGSSFAQGYFKRIQTKADFSLYSIDFADSLVGYIGGRFGGFLKTEDGGQNWNAIEVESAPWIFGAMDVIDLEFTDKNSGFAIVGDRTQRNFNAAIWKTSDGGINWSLAQVRTNIVPWRLDPIGPDSGLVGGTSYFQGAAISNISGDSIIGFKSLSWDASLRIEAIARHKNNPNFIMLATNYNSSIYRSFNGGITWDTIMGVLDTGFNDLIHVGGDLWVGTINNGRSIQSTKDSGKTWTWHATTFAYPTYVSVSLSSRDSLIFVGYSESSKMGEISFFDENRWDRYQSVPMRLHATACNKAGDAFVVGDSGALYRRTQNSMGINKPKSSISYLFPNPVKSKLHFSKPTEGKVKVFDSAGKIVLSKCAKNNILDLSSLETGNYIIQFRLKDNQALKRTKVTKME